MFSEPLNILSCFFYSFSFCVKEKTVILGKLFSQHLAIVGPYCETISYLLESVLPTFELMLA